MLLNTEFDVFLEEASRARQSKRDIRVGTWNFRSLYRTGSLTVAARELARYKLDLVGYRRLGGTKGALYRQGTIISSIEREMKIIIWEQDFLDTKGYHQRLRE